MEIVENKINPPKPKYDPKKKYSWGPDTVFELKGEEFGAVLNAVRAMLHLPEATAIIWADKANSRIEEIFARAVEQGLVKEDIK